MHNAEMERLAARVRASARDGGLIETAQVKLIGLDEVREAAGPRWPRMREYVREGSIKIIAEHIGPDDAVIACGDGFLVVFADATNERTQHRCTEIREALLGFYLGEEMLSALHADVQREATSAANLAGFVANTATRSAPCRTALMLGRFWPVWSARLQTVAAHLCAPAIEGKGGLPRMGYEPAFLETAAHCNTDFLDLDLCLLAQACAAAERPAAGPVGVSVHATTLQRRRSRQTYLDHVAANAGVIHQRMFITIAEIEPGTPLISLSEWASALVQTFSRIALDLHHSDRALTSLASAGIWAAGYHLPLTHAASELELRKSLTLLDSWCRTFRRQNILPFVSGFVHQGFLEMAHYSNLAFATGEAIWPSTIDPVSVNVARRETGRSACATS